MAQPATGGSTTGRHLEARARVYPGTQTAPAISPDDLRRDTRSRPRPSGWSARASAGVSRSRPEARAAHSHGDRARILTGQRDVPRRADLPPLAREAAWRSAGRWGLLLTRTEPVHWRQRATAGSSRHPAWTSGRDASSGASAQAGPTRTPPRREAGDVTPAATGHRQARQRADRTGGSPSRRRKRQEGTDRGDAERLSTRTSSEGVNSVARTGATDHGAIRGTTNRETRRTSNRQRGATNPRRIGGASRQGSAKLRRRNGS